MGVLNQLSGVNAILHYINDIFAQAGFKLSRQPLDEADASGGRNSVANA
jgi:hypothetical protein